MKRQEEKILGAMVLLCLRLFFNQYINIIQLFYYAWGFYTYNSV